MSIDIDQLQEELGLTIDKNDEARSLFFNSFTKHMSFGKFNFDYIDKNYDRTHKGLRDVFDIILTNSRFMVIVEVKNKLNKNDVKTVLKKIKNFRILFPQHKDSTIYGAVAGLSMTIATIAEAKKHGFYVFTHDGANLKILNDQVTEYTNTDI